MQTFYVIIMKDYMTIYEKKDNVYERVYLDGNAEYSYSVNSTKDYINRFFELLMEEYNMETKDEIGLIVLENEDDLISRVVVDAFGPCVKKRIGIEDLMPKVFESIGHDKSLRIHDYGINYDGKQYMITDNKVLKENFSLLAYTMSDDGVIEFLG